MPPKCTVCNDTGWIQATAEMHVAGYPLSERCSCTPTNANRTEDEMAVRCECMDPGCPQDHGDSCQHSATMIVTRNDMDDESGVAMCDSCGIDALESGVFRVDANVGPDGHVDWY